MVIRSHYIIFIVAKTMKADNHVHLRMLWFQAAPAQLPNREVGDTSNLQAQLSAVKAAFRDKKTVDASRFSPAVVQGSLQMLFELGDRNKDGVLDQNELVHLLGVSGFDFDIEQVAKLIKKCDTNGDGVLQYEEFLPMMMEHLESLRTTKQVPQW